MPLALHIGLDALNSYRRLAYTPWHAIAEFVDNATQSYFDNRDVLDAALTEDNEPFGVSIVYERTDEEHYLRISDNAMGMSYAELERALHIGLPPENPIGRSKYGMGLKTAASWLGDLWTVRTKKLNETTEHSVTVDIEGVVSAGDGTLPHVVVENLPPNLHYTIVEIRALNRNFYGRTLGKIRDYLRSMYRQDFRHNQLVLHWRGEPLEWTEPPMLKARDGSSYQKDFAFAVDGKKIHGWVGILARGSRASAGFSILHCGRVVRGWPDAWRPSSLYGQIQGTNDLVNQRLVGEIHVDDFDVSHTKDDILWLGSQEQEVEDQLLVHCGEYKAFAQQYRKREDDERGPPDAELDAAIDEFRKELNSPEMVDRISLHDIPSQDAVRESVKDIAASAESRHTETLAAVIGNLRARVYIDHEMSVNDWYVVADSTKEDEVLVIVNTAHPHWLQLKGSDGVLNYLRHCTYDAIAEWQARHQAARLDTDTIKVLKDRLLRVSFDIERHQDDEDAPN